MLAMAQFLSTETEPKLYYKPWLLSPKNEAIIKAQVEEAEVLIEEEKSQWASRHPEQGLKTEEKSEVKVTSDVMMMGEPHTESPSISNVDTTNPTSALVAQSSQVKTEKDNLEEHNGEFVQAVYGVKAMQASAAKPPSLGSNLVFGCGDTGPCMMWDQFEVRVEVRGHDQMICLSIIKIKMVDKLTPQDSRVQYKSADVNGRTYSYILAEPKDGAEPVATIFLIHGWPDMAFGWRYQIPALQALNFRVVVPNMQGYASSSSPQELSAFTYKTAADDVAALAKVIGVTSIILGGHDWGGAIVYRIALHYPQLIRAVFSVCTPFFPPQKTYVPMTVRPNFKYQLQLQGPDVEREIVGKEKLRMMLNALYGGRTPERELGFSVAEGVLFANLASLGPSPLLSGAELDFYAEQYAIHGIRGPLNWYRTGELNFEDEKEMAEDFHRERDPLKIDIPTMFIAGTRDAALPPAMGEGMMQWFVEGRLRREEVDSSHWALWEKSEEVNAYIKDFVLGVVGGKGLSHL
ncbi:hypothetical protein NHQ30_010319 [Ciborinia camelliae]|nr:hypothetical protein NHQ30_010319 [Ciborinia camelliae]